MKSHRLFNMYLTTTISISLVLFLIGLECVGFLSARKLVNNLRENVTMTVVMNDSANAEDIKDMQEVIKLDSRVASSRFISREEALQDHIKNLGEDPSEFLGYNPLSDAFEIHLKASHSHLDTLKAIDAQLSTLAYVDDVIYHAASVETLNSNLNKVSFVLLIIAGVLLVIALVLMSNTIQLQIYSKRFIINTMRLVGATPWVIKWPFIRRNILMGLEAALLACMMIALVYYYCSAKLGVILFPLTTMNIVILVMTVVMSGLMITFLASLAATNKYIRMKTNKLYEI